MRRERERPFQGGSVDVSVVVPAHNEEGNILPLMDQFGELARRARFSFEVVAVDDGSRDRTLPRLVDAQRVHRFIRIVSLPRRRGLTEALQAGFAASRGHTIVFYPADRQFHPNDIPRMVDRLRDGYDLVTGRKIGQYNKRVVSGLYNRLSRWLFPSISVTDLNSVKAFRRELIDVFDYRHDWHRFWVAIAAEAGYRIGEVDVTLYQRTTGYSKFGWWRIPGGVLDLLAVKFQYHTMRRPLWYFGMTGTVLFAIAVLIGGWAFYLRFFMNQGYRPLLYLVMILGISSVIFFTLGFLAESIAGVRQRIESLRGGPKFQLYHPSAGRADAPVSQPQQPVAEPARAEQKPPPAADASRGRGQRGDRRHGQNDRRREDRRPRPEGSRNQPQSAPPPREERSQESTRFADGEPQARISPVPVSVESTSPANTVSREHGDEPISSDLFDRPASADAPPPEERRPAAGSDEAGLGGGVTEDGPVSPLPSSTTERPGTPFGRRNRR